MPLTPIPKDFDLKPDPDRPAITVLFKPTRSEFVFTVVTDPSDRARVGGWISPAFSNSSPGKFGDYSESEVVGMALTLARAMAEKNHRGA